LPLVTATRPLRISEPLWFSRTRCARMDRRVHPDPDRNHRPGDRGSAHAAVVRVLDHRPATTIAGERVHAGLCAQLARPRQRIADRSPVPAPLAELRARSLSAPLLGAGSRAPTGASADSVHAPRAP